MKVINVTNSIILIFFFCSIHYVVINGIKTFYEEDLQTSHFFNSDTRGKIDLCETLGRFYKIKSEYYSLTQYVRFKNSQMLYCQGDMETFQNYTNKPKLEKIESIVICHHHEVEFNPNNLEYFTKVKNLYIAESSFDHFVGRFPQLENLEFINITNTHLKTIKSDLFAELSSILLIDLRFNKLTTIEKLSIMNYKGVKVYLFGNQWNCTTNLKWISSHDYKFEIVDRKNLNCTDIKYRGRPVDLVMSTKLQLSKMCTNDHDLRNCSCRISYLRWMDEYNAFHPMYNVNCSAMGFYDFPRQLPENTSTFFFTNNRISSLNMLCIKNSTYNNVHDMHLDYNEIADVSVLENCEWFLNFRVLSLKGNLIEKIPNYAFKNSFEKSHHAIRLYLSENPWLCSCKLQPRLMKLCQKYELITDQKEMRCLSLKNDADIYGKAVMELKHLDVCKVNKFPLNIYEITSIVFSVLIILVLSNLLYDYYMYKNYGKLPWIVLNTPFI